MMMPSNINFNLDTGTQRHILGHAISGAIAVGVVSSVNNAKKVKEEKLQKKEAIRNTIKDSIIGGVATATAISVTNNIGNPNKSLFQALGSLAIGLGAIYTIEKSAAIQNEKLLIKENKEENE
ncbi:hypothetical protein [Sulfurimonas sp.]|uniref:hypothetical protein n=1 Tax=Sulfurimonas sp. TaxID=2022749 RepID=UPI0025EE0281|nr:hypothetical protein [Sulfurimonas sp.]